VLLLFILIGSAGPNFNTDAQSAGSGAVLAGNRLSYFFLAASGPLGWAPASADFYSYYPPSTSRVITTAMTSSGIICGKLLIEFLGIGLASGIATVPSWAAAFDQSTGALIAEAFAPLGGFGKFCAVVLALCVSANNIPGTYAAALNFQMFGRWPAKIPRPIWSTFVVIIYTVCAIAGRAQLLTIFLNFLSLIGYWVIIWIVMTLEEELIFRKSKGYVWETWNDRTRLPAGYAALASFLVGWAGAILGMSQTYFTGPIAHLVGDGADVRSNLMICLCWEIC
jgi:purine-cytosine permease-like protein